MRVCVCACVRVRVCVSVRIHCTVMASLTTNNKPMIRAKATNNNTTNIASIAGNIKLFRDIMEYRFVLYRVNLPRPQSLTVFLVIT